MQRRSLSSAQFAEPFGRTSGRCGQCHLIIGIQLLIQQQDAVDHRRLSRSRSAVQDHEGMIEKASDRRFLAFIIGDIERFFHMLDRFVQIFWLRSRRLRMIQPCGDHAFRRMLPVIIQPSLFFDEHAFFDQRLQRLIRRKAIALHDLRLQLF